jgi:hypothetical protein
LAIMVAAVPIGERMIMRENREPGELPSVLLTELTELPSSLARSGDISFRLNSCNTLEGVLPDTVPRSVLVVGEAGLGTS